ncbi:MAG: glutamyl-tRNA reductase [Proteobacteria bacterium ST_bin12]|nr:MAG: glutamyl-tRNA reductase [Proteobacteria bacterium ST_bin12]
MQLYTIGVNHTTAPISIREHVAFNSDILHHALSDLTAHNVAEAAILSTCNRTEIYVQSANPEPVVNWLAQYHRLDLHNIQPYTYTLSNQEAVKHAFRVASGLDSMVLGEPQILGQFKQSVKVAQDAGTLGTLLHKLFQRTFEVAKEVRTNTDIGGSSISMAAAAVKLAQRIFGDIKHQKILLIGAGEMIELCADHFAAQKPKSMTVANRTIERGALLAAKINAQAVNAEAILLNNLPERFAEFDIVITSTASQLPIVGLGMVERAIKTRRHRPIFMVDLAVPRDIEPEVAQLDDVFLYTVDDLAQVVNDGMENRQTAAINAEMIVAARVEGFMQWLKKRDAVPTIKALRDQAEAVRINELEKALKLIQKGENPAIVLDMLSNALTNKFLHAPSHALNAAHGDEHARLEQLLRQLYHIKN